MCQSKFDPTVSCYILSICTHSFYLYSSRPMSIAHFGLCPIKHFLKQCYESKFIQMHLSFQTFLQCKNTILDWEESFKSVFYFLRLWKNYWFGFFGVFFQKNQSFKVINLLFEVGRTAEAQAAKSLSTSVKVSFNAMPCYISYSRRTGFKDCICALLGLFSQSQSIPHHAFSIIMTMKIYKL